tara:strand:- start:92 stop:424 length:333 start_codon:yes stop_codon:yes gene_type:complete
MNKNFRLTVHVANQPKVDTRAPLAVSKKGPQKSAVDLARETNKNNKGNTTQVSSKGRYKLYNTLSFYCKSIEDCHKKLADVKTKYDIQLGNDHNKPKKYGKELYNISCVK